MSAGTVVIEDSWQKGIHMHNVYEEKGILHTSNMTNMANTHKKKLYRCLDFPVVQLLFLFPL